MRNRIIVLVVVLAMTSVASAATIRGIDIEFVSIGNAGNAADTRERTDETSGYGAVGYNYSIGKYEITNAQWNAFTTAAGAPTGNPSNAYDNSAVHSGDQQPTNEVSWYEAAQFCNYLTSGDKSLGAYQFNGNNTNPGDFLDIDRASAISAYGIVYVIPTENEWYKAAYYTGSGYSLYANGTDTAPIMDDDTNYHWAIGSPWNVGVGNGTEEQNGTFDMMGNVWEWNETLINNKRGLVGNSYSIAPTLEEDQNYLSAAYRSTGYQPDDDNLDMGFRITSVPEPATLSLLLISGLALFRRRPR